MNNFSAETLDEHLVDIPLGPATLYGNLALPLEPTGVVLFAQGSVGGRHGPRSRYVARQLNEAKLATLLLDLLTPEEEEIDLRTRLLQLNIRLLAERIVGATDWLAQNPAINGLRIGYFGTSTGAAAAFEAATMRPDPISAIISRGGRPDLAGTALTLVRSPTLLIVGGNDFETMELNREAFKHLRCEKKLAVVPGATHLFEEPGALDDVVSWARMWFMRFLPS
ncbi:dienelactone hydrolase family protein [Bradyrhizobium manausense]|uniref:Hydrolase n=1 Tax=Bradyrhizobium manausense TaxID=989370 RepID=A0A0R3ECN9_9BRAD|nr:dienelactone hydrolase family protein [Bradyrhizobium manausense]KRQ17788.1 hydrolase [Bradyrhizobium manausense]